jgi:hypothetical protein
MIAIDTMRLTLATIAARLTPTWPGAPRSCASPIRADTGPSSGAARKQSTAMRGISTTAPISRSAIAA